MQILTVDHPRNAAEREATLELEHPIRIGRNVWVREGVVIIFLGVTVGHDAVIGASSVVIRDILAGAAVMDNPAHVLSRTLDKE